MTDTTAQHIAARDDADLKARLIAATEQAGIQQAASWVEQRIGGLVSTEFGEGETLTSVYASAAAVHDAAVAALPLPPGLDPAAVTDAQLAQAIQAVWAPVPVE